MIDLVLFTLNWTQTAPMYERKASLLPQKLISMVSCRPILSTVVGLIGVQSSWLLSIRHDSLVSQRKLKTPGQGSSASAVQKALTEERNFLFGLLKSELSISLFKGPTDRLSESRLNRNYRHILSQ